MRNFIITDYRARDGRTWSSPELVAEGTEYTDGWCVLVWLTKKWQGEEKPALIQFMHEHPVLISRSSDKLLVELRAVDWSIEYIWASEDKKDTCPVCGKLYAWIYESRAYTTATLRDRALRDETMKMLLEELHSTPFLCRGTCNQPAFEKKQEKREDIHE